jgi:N-acetylglucosamine-6-phosphate deacetylase
MFHFRNARLILADRIVLGSLAVDGDRIAATDDGVSTDAIDLAGKYLAPGFIDLHVHGGDGHDFMDATPEAFLAVCRAHVRHGTTWLLPTTTVARHDQHLAVLKLCRDFHGIDTGGARSLGCHFYGPYFAPEARGCHPASSVRSPLPTEYAKYLEYADCICRATVAPELPNAEAFLLACTKHGIAGNIGHSHATFAQVEAARGWGATHVDHLFCAMSDRAKLRLAQPFPMRGGVMEATLFFDDLTTEIIADGKHLDASLMRLAYKIKGPDRLALVTDCSRALDCPDGEYLFGPKDGGEPFLKRDGVGLMPDGKALASSVVGMDHCVRTMHQIAGVPLAEAIRMASLTPARIAGVADRLGSLAVGKVADLVVLDESLQVEAVYVCGTKVFDARARSASKVESSTS